MCISVREKCTWWKMNDLLQANISAAAAAAAAAALAARNLMLSLFEEMMNHSLQKKSRNSEVVL